MTPDGSATLTLDLGDVVGVRGRVAATAPFDDVRVEVRDARGTTLRTLATDADGAFGCCVALDRPGLALVATRGDACSAPVPLTAGMLDVQLVLPQ